MSTKELLNEAEIHTVDGNASTMSNEDGYFILKCSKDTKAIAVNALGYRQEVIAISSLSKFDNITKSSSQTSPLTTMFVGPVR